MPTPLDAEAAAWRDLPRDEYDRTVYALLDALPAADPAVLPLASATLRRDAPTLTDSVARCAERLIDFAATATEPDRARS
ncbi:hypothetical protein AB0M20_12145, partial [Actinoplanes sp. NPDC051633]|uniref:hypothetical protein n=1 Tax=Actinoplanes sp. NPDC051633 TaxID=3155670 RepID=UPI00341B8F86